MPPGLNLGPVMWSSTVVIGWVDLLSRVRVLALSTGLVFKASKQQSDDSGYDHISDRQQ